jgi:hypothetical protein
MKPDPFINNIYTKHLKWSTCGKTVRDESTRHNMPIHSILSTAPQLSISQMALGTLPEDGNVMPKHVGATIHY